MCICHVDAMFCDVVKTLVDINAGLFFSSNDLDGFENVHRPYRSGKLLTSLFSVAANTRPIPLNK